MVSNSHNYAQFLNFKIMKKLFFIALVALASTQVSCSDDSEVVTPTAKVTPLNEEFSLMQRPADSIPEGETGGQGGTIPPTKP
jgi:hypothetical protein